MGHNFELFSDFIDWMKGFAYSCFSDSCSFFQASTSNEGQGKRIRWKGSMRTGGNERKEWMKEEAQEKS